MNNDWKFMAVVSSAIIGVYGWLLKHLANTKKHPCSDDIVFKDVCKEKTKRLEDCIEAQVKLETERYENLKTSIDEVKDLIRGQND